jgi:hypothetical protein
MKLVPACAVLAIALGAATGLVGAGSAAAGADAAAPIVTVVRHGGLCITRTECRQVLRITNSTISADGFVPRRLRRSDRASLLRAIRALRPAVIRAYPFTGTCPVAYDGTESIYRFRGFPLELASCTYDLGNVRAVRLTERLLATLKPKPR